MDVLPKFKFLNAVTAFTHFYGFLYLDHLQPKESIYMEPLQDLNPKCR